MPGILLLAGMFYFISVLSVLPITLSNFTSRLTVTLMVSVCNGDLSASALLLDILLIINLSFDLCRSFFSIFVSRGLFNSVFLFYFSNVEVFDYHV